MVPASVEERFGLSTPSIRIIASEVKAAVFNHCDRESFAYLGRTKTIESAWEKIEGGRYKKWSELDDFFGCTIIIPTLNHEQKVLDFLCGAFEQAKIRRRTDALKSPDVFRFDATRFYGRLRTPPDHGSFENLLFEVQVRTAFEHAWSVTTHALTYKNDVVQWRRLRLAAQLKASVEQLDLLVASFDETSSHVIQHQWHDIAAKAQIIEYFQEKFQAGHFPAETRPKDLGRFAQNLLSIMPIKGNNKKSWDTSFDALKKRLDGVSAKMVPRSLSLLQFVICEGFATKLIVPSEKVALPVTREVVSLFPHMNECPSVFDLDG